MTERARDLHEHDEREEKHTRHSQTSTSRSFQTVTFRQHTRGRNAPRPAAVTHATPVAVHGPPKFAWHRNSPPADVLRHGPCGRHHRVGIRIPTRALERHLTGHRATRGSNQQSRMEVIRGRVRSRTVAIAPGSRGIIWIARAFRGRYGAVYRRGVNGGAPPTDANVRPTAMDQCAADYTLGSSTRHAHHNATRIRPTKPTGNRHEYN